MADVPGQPRPDLGHSDPAPKDLGFFELLRRLEREGLRFGRAGGPGDEPARLGQRARLAMAARDIASFTPPGETTPAKVEVEVLGLLGPEGAMPLHMTRWIMARQSERWFGEGSAGVTADTTFLDFLNMLQHRQLAFYWRAWGDLRPEVAVEYSGGGRARALLQTLAGLGLPGLERANQRSADPDLARRQAAALGHQVHGVERLTLYLSDLLKLPVRLREFVGHWLEIPRPLQSRLGQQHCGLGRGAILGPRLFQRQDRAELRLGPMDLQRYHALTRDGAALAQIRRAIRFVCGSDITFDLRLELARDQVPPPHLGKVALGRDIWLGGGPKGRAEEFVIRGFSDRVSEVAA
ncbi:type VI secretion system baseplate subunit TssG [Xinfangfangia sp. CPCC 101601]|uniref:Type VI secretion system baseplate subunit TssG n=1 Tax=Pseudogemmobacter lacusdianii TaxID=3069608 RepID=A0ABU0VVB4_9RHOB|nr:type VI secretion system baseplate subunit TssG [Xinfangfangia sp. CPCC 101601]MDQ2065694.1 type VI secretion system baseplate subunit TssG [Xinfangfangia sp. CPCC 101601]